MKALVIGTCPWIKSSHGAITKSIANTLSKDSTVVVLGLNHDATMFGDGVKSSINNSGMNEIEILCLSKDASISTITVYEIYKNWKFDLVVTVGDIVQFDWLKAFFEFSKCESRWISFLTENIKSVISNNPFVDVVFSFNANMNSSSDHIQIYPDLIWKDYIKKSNCHKLGCISKIGLVGKNDILSNFHICKRLSQSYKLEYFNTFPSQSYFSDEQLSNMGVSICPGFRLPNFWDNDNNLIDFINNNDGFILLDDTPDFGFYSYILGQTNKKIISSVSRVRCSLFHYCVSSIFIPSNSHNLDGYYIFNNTPEIELSLDAQMCPDHKIYSIERGILDNVIEIIIDTQSKLFIKQKRTKELNLESYN